MFRSERDLEGVVLFGKGRKSQRGGRKSGTYQERV